MPTRPRLRGGFAEVTVTESFIDHEYAWRHEHGLDVWSNPMTTFHMESIMTLAEAIKAHGAVASIQLNHVGAMNHPDAIPGHKNPIGPSAFVREDGVQVEEMTVEMMEKTAAQWAEAAWNCKALGFNMVNLHGGHGWLLNQFISPRFNHRTDEFGGSMANRARFPIMVCKKIKEVCGDDFLIEYRMSGSERIEGGMTLEDGIEFAQIIQDYVDLIHVTSGVYQDHVNTKAFSSMFDAHGCNLDLAEAIKKHVHVPVVAVGGFNGPDQIEEAIASGKCDFVALGRQQFADPAFVNKTLQGREDEIAPCLRCSCFNPLASDPDARPIPELWHCAVNPWSGRELRWRNAPRPTGKRRVLVIGGGPAGLYAAATAAERGHDVILVEACKNLGGLLWFTDVDGHKESLRRYRDSLIARCCRLGVKFQLGTTATKEYIQQMHPDAVICAVGSSPAKPPIPGIDKAHHALYCYDKPEAVGKKVIMIGGGLIGCETGYWAGGHRPPGPCAGNAGGLGHGCPTLPPGRPPAPNGQDHDLELLRHRHRGHRKRREVHRPGRPGALPGGGHRAVRRGPAGQLQDCGGAQGRLRLVCGRGRLRPSPPGQAGHLRGLLRRDGHSVTTQPLPRPAGNSGRGVFSEFSREIFKIMEPNARLLRLSFKKSPALAPRLYAEKQQNYPAQGFITVVLQNRPGR